MKTAFKHYHYLPTIDWWKVRYWGYKKSKTGKVLAKFVNICQIFVNNLHNNSLPYNFNLFYRYISKTSLETTAANKCCSEHSHEAVIHTREEGAGSPQRLQSNVVGDNHQAYFHQNGIAMKYVSKSEKIYI